MTYAAADEPDNFKITGMTKSCIEDFEILYECSTTNDDPNIDDVLRMEKLKKLFKRRGLKLIFKNIPKSLMKKTKSK